MKKRVTARIAILIVCTIVLTMLPVVQAGAVSFSGKGTKSNPYLVETPEQLQAISEDLSAHYKLNNTIDASSLGEFKSIGNLSAPFTGSFTCDVDSDGTPKYAIKNLKIYNHAGERYNHAYGTNNYVDYKKNQSGWEAALFGYAKGAAFENIAILDANIVNSVVGQNDMNKDFSLNPGQQEEMATGTLLAIGSSVKIENCSATGVMDSKSNNAGGLVGRLTDSSKVTKSYAKVNMTTKGYWYCGGFLGGDDFTTTITYCFATGDVTGTGYTNRSFMGGVGGRTEYCYGAGKVVSGGSDDTPFYYVNKLDPAKVNIKHCVTLSTVTSSDGLAIPQTGDNTLENYCLEGVYELHFQPTTKAVIEEKISEINEQIAIISDTAKYVPHAVSAPGGAGANPDNNDAASGGESAEYTAEELTNEVAVLYEKLPELTREDALLGMTLKDKLTGLSDAEYAKLEDDVNDDISEIYNKSVDILLLTLTEGMEQLPGKSEINADNAQAVVDLYEIYEALTEELREYLDPELVSRLQEAYPEAKEYVDSSVVVIDVDPAVTTLQRIIVIVLVCFNVMGLVGLGITVAFIIKKINREKKK